MLNYEHRKTIDALRRDGYAVLIFSPEELRGLDSVRVEECLRLGFKTLSARKDVNEILKGKDDESSNNTH